MGRGTLWKSTGWNEEAILVLQGGAGKSLTLPGRKQATATKLGINSTHTPRSSIHSLAHCYNFCKPLKKNPEGCLSNQVSAAAMTSVSDKKWWPFVVSSVQRTGGNPTGADPENRVGDQDIGSPGRLVSSGLQVPSEPGHCLTRTSPPVTFPWYFSFKISFNCTSRDK